MLQWFLSAVDTVEQQVCVDELMLDARDAVQEGFDALRGALRYLEVMGEEDYARWLRARQRRARVSALGQPQCARHYRKRPKWTGVSTSWNK